jgi:hypothetical protein
MAVTFVNLAGVVNPRTPDEATCFDGLLTNDKLAAAT